MDDELGDVTECPVCFESYEECGEHVPRLLPCTHTLCENCVRGLLKEKSLRCPECRTTHPAPNEVLKFPQNKYILILIRKVKKGENEQTSGRCGEGYQKEKMKQSAFNQQRKSHGKDEILARVEDLQKKLESHKQKFLDARDTLENAKQNCLDKMKNSQQIIRTVINERFGDMFKNVSVRARRAKGNIESNIARIHENMLLLNSIRKNFERDMLAGDTENRLENLDVIEETFESIFTEPKTYQFFDYDECPREEVDKLCGHLIEKETVWWAPEASFQQMHKKAKRKTPKAIVEADEGIQRLESTKNAEPRQMPMNPSKLKCKGVCVCLFWGG